MPPGGPGGGPGGPGFGGPGFGGPGFVPGFAPPPGPFFCAPGLLMPFRCGPPCCRVPGLPLLFAILTWGICYGIACIIIANTCGDGADVACSSYYGVSAAIIFFIMVIIYVSFLICVLPPPPGFEEGDQTPIADEKDPLVAKTTEQVSVTLSKA